MSTITPVRSTWFTRLPQWKRLVIMFGTPVVIVGLIAGLAALGEPSHASGAAGACIDAVGAARGYVTGTESRASASSTLADAEDALQSSVRQDGKFEPILRSVVTLRRELDAQTLNNSSSALVYLNGQCGDAVR